MKDDYISRLTASIVLPHIALEELERIPAADVQPARHGLWNYHDSFALECSNCGWINYHNMGVPNAFNYCPNCGCAMREGEDQSGN